MVRDRLAELRERAGLLPVNGSNGISMDHLAGGDAGGASDDFVHAGDVRILIGSNNNGSGGGRRSSPPHATSSRIDPSYSASDLSPSFMEQFFARINSLYRSLDELAQNIATVRRLHDEVLHSVNEATVSRSRQQRDSLMLDIKRHAERAHGELKSLDKDNFDEERKPQPRSNNALRQQEVRIRRSQFESLSQRFREIMEDYNHAQVSLRDRSKEKLKRQLIITGKAPENDAALDEMLENGNAHIFTQGIVAQTESARAMLQDIENRHTDIVKLEQSIKELHDLFLDMAMLVQDQGQMVDNIERNVEGATASVEHGAVQLRSAKQLQRSARCKIICLVTFLICVVLFILLMLHFYAKLF